jgi:hypothetical protein
VVSCVTDDRTHNPPVVAARLIRASDGRRTASIFPGRASFQGRNTVISACLLALPSRIRSGTRANATAPADGEPEQADTAGGSLERHPELPGNTTPLSCPARLRWSARGATDGGYVTGRHRSPVAHGYGVFPGGVGNTQKDPARFASLYHDVSSKIFGRLPDTTWVYPGHGGDTTLGTERPHLEEWRERGW